MRWEVRGQAVGVSRAHTHLVGEADVVHYHFAPLRQREALAAQLTATQVHTSELTPADKVLTPANCDVLKHTVAGDVRRVKRDDEMFSCAVRNTDQSAPCRQAPALDFVRTSAATLQAAALPPTGQIQDDATPGRSARSSASLESGGGTITV